MPKIVDHDQRRAAISEAACEIIAGEGLEGTTLAKVGRGVGLTTGAIRHYFSDKDALLEAALRFAYAEQLERMAARAARVPYSLLDVLAESLPRSAPSRRSMKVWLAFWGRAVGDARTARVQRVIHEDWTARVEAELARALSLGLLPPEVNPAEESEALIAQIRGICIRAILDPETWHPERQLALLSRYLDRLATHAGQPMARASGARR